MINLEEKEKLLARLLELRSKYKKQKGYIRQCTRTSFNMATPEVREELKERHDYIIKDTSAITARGVSILGFLMRNVQRVDDKALAQYLDGLDSLCDDTTAYYANIVDIPGRLPQKHFDTLIESEEMTLRAMALLDNERTIRKYLGFEDEFWEYLDDPKAFRLRHVDSLNSEIIEHESFVVPILTPGENTIDGIIVQIPYVKNKETALKAIDVLSRAYKHYKRIGDEWVKQEKDQSVADDYVYTLRNRQAKNRIK